MSGRPSAMMLNPAIAGPMFFREMKKQECRKTFGALLAGKMIGVCAALRRRPRTGAGTSAPNACAQEVTAAAGPVGRPTSSTRSTPSWVLVAAFLVFFMQAGLHDARGRLRPGAGDGQHPARVHRRHVPVRHAVLGLRLRLHVRRGQRLHRPQLLLPQHATRPTYGTTGDRLPGVLPVPVRLRRHLLDHHVGRHGRSHGVRRRPHLLVRRERLHLPDHRPLDLGSGRLARPR